VWFERACQCAIASDDVECVRQGGVYQFERGGSRLLVETDIILRIGKWVCVVNRGRFSSSLSVFLREIADVFAFRMII